VKTRGSDLQKDSHLVETDALAATAENVAEPLNDDDEGEGGVIDDLLGDDNLRILGELHDRGVLINPDLTLQDLPKLHADTIDNPVIGDTDLQLEVENNLEILEDDPEQILNPDPNPDPPMLSNTDPAAIDIANILPANTRRQRRIRFNLPVLR